MLSRFGTSSRLSAQDIRPEFGLGAELLSHARRITGNNRVCRDILCYHGTGSNHGVCSDGNSRDDRGIGSDAGILANHGRQIFDMSIRPRVKVVGEHYSMPDEDVLLKSDVGAEKGMTHDAAVCADDHSACYLDERPHKRTIPDVATKQIDLLRIENDYIATQNYISINHGIFCSLLTPPEHPTWRLHNRKWQR